MFKEIAGDIPDYRCPFDKDGWLEIVLDYAGGGPAREKQLGRMGSFVAPRWSDHFKLVDQFLGAI